MMEATMENVDLNDDVYPTQTIKAVILGNSSVGKTNIVKAYESPHYVVNLRHPLQTTLGVDFVTKTKDITIKETNQIVPVHVRLWDTAGQERFQSLILNYCRNVQIIILVFETPESDLEQHYASLRALPEWYDKIKKAIFQGEEAGDRQSTIFAICMSKCDRWKSLKEPKRLAERCKEMVSQICTEENDVKGVYMTSVVENENKNQTGEYYVQHMMDDLVYRATLLLLKQGRDNPKTEAEFSLPRGVSKRSSKKIILTVRNNGESTLDKQEEQSGCC